MDCTKGLQPLHLFRYFATEWMLKIPKGPPSIFFITVTLFKNLNFLKSPKCLPFNFFLFCNKLEFQKAQRVPPFTILKTSRFLYLRYSADFGHSRLVIFLNSAKINHNFVRLLFPNLMGKFQNLNIELIGSEYFSPLIC